MASIFDLLHEDLTDERIDLIASKLGTNREQTRDAISASLPAIIEAMGRKMEEPGGEERFQNRLFNQSSPSSAGDDGSMLDKLNDIIHREGGSAAPASSNSRGNVSNNSFSGSDNRRPNTPAPSQPKSDDADSNGGSGDIMGDLFGKRKERVKDAVSKSSGIGLQQAGSLIAILGPLVLGMLARKQAQKKLNPGDLSGMVKDGRSKVQQSAGGGVIAKIFDQDGDGDFDLMDVLSLAKTFLFRR